MPTIKMMPNVFLVPTLFADAGRCYHLHRPTLAHTHPLSLCLSVTLLSVLIISHPL